MNKQFLFDTAVQGLLRQRDYSIAIGGCAYRSPGGNKCAIGFAIPDENYSKDLETLRAHQPEVQRAIGLEYSDDNRQFLYRLQQDLHDDMYMSGPWTEEEFRARATAFAEEWKLTVNF